MTTVLGSPHIHLGHELVQALILTHLNDHLPTFYTQINWNILGIDILYGY